MKRPVVLSLAIAVPFEILSLALATPPLDVGLADDATWYQTLLAGQWAILHLPGIWLSFRVEKLGLHIYAYPNFWIYYFIFGCLDTAMLILVCIYAYRLLSAPREKDASGAA
jgi:hypothetical protein